MKYNIPDQTRIGHVHLKVANLKHSLHFYCDILGFEITMKYGEEAAFISTGGYHHHISLNTWQSKNAPRASKHGVGLYHTAILYPTRKDLGRILKRLNDFEYPLTGAADHGVSEPLYLDDPDANGVELYWDRPKEEWPLNTVGEIDMFTKPLNLNNLLELAD
jgi:catechol 2,3-dioxygenase